MDTHCSAAHCIVKILGQLGRQFSATIFPERLGDDTQAQQSKSPGKNQPRRNKPASSPRHTPTSSKSHRRTWDSVQLHSILCSVAMTVDPNPQNGSRIRSFCVVLVNHTSEFQLSSPRHGPPYSVAECSNVSAIAP